MNDKYADSIIKHPSLYKSLHVHGVIEIETDDSYCQINDESPEFYSVYIQHHDSPEVECIGDFADHQDALTYAEEISLEYGLNWPVINHTTGAATMNKKHINEALNHLYTDLLLLESGEWVPDTHSVGASIDNVVLIASELDLELTDTRDNMQYYTYDHTDGHIDEGAEIYFGDISEDAIELDPPRDAWIKSKTISMINNGVLLDVNTHTSIPVTIRNPGNHPGLPNYFWINPCGPVYGL